MARVHSLLVLMLAFLVSCSTSDTIVVLDAALVDQVCKQTQNYDFCVRALYSDPRSASSDIIGLGRISLDLAYRNASDTHGFICRLLPSTNDPRMRQALTHCCQRYDLAMFWIRDAYRYLDRKFSDNLNSDMNEVYAQGRMCEDSFKGMSINSPLGPRNKNLEHLSQITMVISSLL